MLRSQMTEAQRAMLAAFREAHTTAGWDVSPRDATENDEIDITPESNASRTTATGFVQSFIVLAEAQVVITVARDDSDDFRQIVFELDADWRRILTWMAENAGALTLENYSKTLARLVPFPPRVGIRTPDGELTWFSR